MPPTRSPEVVTPRLLRSWPLPSAGEDKYSRGVVLVVGGSGRTPGAALLAGIAALRAGAGQLRLALAATAAAATAIAVPEALVVPLPCDERSGTIDPDPSGWLDDVADGVDALCVGPGLQDRAATGALTAAVLLGTSPTVPAVLDA